MLPSSPHGSTDVHRSGQICCSAGAYWCMPWLPPTSRCQQRVAHSHGMSSPGGAAVQACRRPLAEPLRRRLSRSPLPGRAPLPGQRRSPPSAWRAAGAAPPPPGPTLSLRRRLLLQRRLWSPRLHPRPQQMLLRTIGSLVSVHHSITPCWTMHCPAKTALLRYSSTLRQVSRSCQATRSPPYMRGKGPGMRRSVPVPCSGKTCAMRSAVRSACARYLQSISAHKPRRECEALKSHCAPEQVTSMARRARKALSRTGS